MRIPTRFGLGLLATALAVPLSVPAVAQQTDDYTPPAPITLDHASLEARPGAKAGVSSAPSAAAAKHHHKGFLGWRHCTECQRARAKAESGIDVPPPPSYVPQGPIIHQGHSAITVTITTPRVRVRWSARPAARPVRRAPWWSGRSR